MNTINLGNCSFRTSRDPAVGDDYIRVKLNSNDLGNTSDLIAVAENINQTSLLLEVLSESYDTPVMLCVNNKDELHNLVDTCFFHNVVINIPSYKDLIKPKKMSHLDKELFKLGVILDEDRVARVASLLVEEIGISYTRQTAIDELRDVDDMITENMATTAIDAALDRFKERVASIKSISCEKRIVESSAEIYQQIKDMEKGVHIVKAPMANGKSYHLIQPMITNGMANGKAQTLVSPRRANVESSVKVEGMLHYRKDMQKVKFKESSVLGMKTVVNSINRPNIAAVIDNSKGLYLDEGQQILKHIISGTVDKREEIYKSLQTAIKETDLVLIADADANDNLVEFVKQTGRTDIYVWEVQADYSDITVEISEYAAVVNDIIDFAAEGKPFRVFGDNAKQMQGLEEKIRKEFGDKNVTCITSKSVEDDASQRFLANPDEEIIKMDVLIHSPAVATTVSINKQYFEAAFGLLEGIVTPQEGVQMALRDRSIKLVKIGLKNTAKRNYDVENKAKYMSKFKEESDFEIMSAKIEADEQFMKNHFVPCFIANLEHDNFNVIFQFAAEENTDAGRQLSGEIKALEKEAYVQGVLNADVATTAEIQNYYENGGESKTGVEEKIHRGEISMLMGVIEVTRDDIDFFERGALKTKINNLSIARMDQAIVNQQDKLDKHRAIRDKKHIKVKHKVFNKIAKMLNLDLKTGKGSYTAVEAAAVLKWIFDNKSDFKKVCDIRVKPTWRNSKAPTKVINNILNSLFKFTIDNKNVRIGNDDDRVRKYSLNTKRFAKINKMLDNSISN